MLHPSPLWAVLAFAFLNSLGTGVISNGVYFLSTHGYGFSTASNYLLGLVFGVTYIGGAFTIGPAIQRLAERSNAVTHRKVLAGVLVVAGLACMLPMAARWASGDPLGGQWALWTLVMLYGPLTGSMWPIVQSYVSGGRTGGDLRSAVGRFNTVWSTALIAAFWLMAPLVELRPLMVMAALGLVHFGTLGLLIPFGPVPGRRVEEAAEPCPAVFVQLLVVFRLLLAASYVVLSALSPYLPAAMRALGVSPDWETPVASIWLVSRVFWFVVLERWQGWHGRWWTPLSGCAMLIVGFGICVLAPPFLGGGVGLAALMVGLAVFGAGTAFIYAGALYYAMEVGRAKVGAGGMHESLIGLGYTLGPACGLLAVAGVRSGVVPETRFEPVVLVLVAGVTGAFCAVAISRAIRRSGRPEVAS